MKKIESNNKKIRLYCAINDMKKNALIKMHACARDNTSCRHSKHNLVVMLLVHERSKELLIFVSKNFSI